MAGHLGKILRVNLTDRKFAAEPFPEAWGQAFFGGRGLAVRLYWEEVDPQTDPLSPENKVIWATGPLTGTGALSAAACYVVTKSPLTGALACARTMGHFGAELKFAGYDAVILEGRAESPLILALLDDKVWFRPAIHLWGRTTREAEAQFKKDLKDEWGARETYLTVIGPAGEKRLSVASFTSQGFLALGGPGVGAVLGAKNLKGLAVKGEHSVLVADGKRLQQVVTTMLNKISGSPYTAEMLPQWGTGFLVPLCAQKGILPQNNFQSHAWGKVIHLGLEALAASFAVKSHGCFACPVACLKQADFHHQDRLARGLGPTYTAIGALGTNLGLTDLPVIGRANMACAALGLDPVAAGGLLALAAELLEKDLANPEALGVDFRFGDGEGLIKAIESLVKTKSLPPFWQVRGDQLAAAWGGSYLFMGVKGAPLAPFDPRALQGLGLHFATANEGPHHASAPTFIDELLGVHQRLEPWDIEGKPELVKEYQDLMAVLDSLGFCHRVLLGLKVAHLIPMVNAVLGNQYKTEELMEVGERIWNLERLFNQRAGFSFPDDRLPERFAKEPLPSGPAQGQVSRVAEMLPRYYQLRGWSPDGVPRPDTLARLGLEDQGTNR
jgi:aldehyde:ferredoxin oxidoreductase